MRDPQWVPLGSNIFLRSDSFRLARHPDGTLFGQILTRFVDSSRMHHDIKNIISKKDCDNGYGQIVTIDVSANRIMDPSSFVLGSNEISSITARFICSQPSMQ